MKIKIIYILFQYHIFEWLSLFLSMINSLWLEAIINMWGHKPHNSNSDADIRVRLCSPGITAVAGHHQITQSRAQNNSFYINTTPRFSKPRRLATESLKIAMLKSGIIRRSNTVIRFVCRSIIINVCLILEMISLKYFS